MSFLRAQSRGSIQRQVVVIIVLVIINFRLFIGGLRGLPVRCPVLIVVDRALHENTSARYVDVTGYTLANGLLAPDLTVKRRFS